MDFSVVEMRLKPERRQKVSEFLDRKAFAIRLPAEFGEKRCSDIFSSPVAIGLRIETHNILTCLKRFCENQWYSQRTRGSHGAMLFDRQLEMIDFAEDVGRNELRIG